jgi:hypothetical protein
MIREHRLHEYESHDKALEDASGALIHSFKGSPAVLAVVLSRAFGEQWRWMRGDVPERGRLVWTVDYTVLGRCARGEPLDDAENAAQGYVYDANDGTRNVQLEVSLDEWLAALGRGELNVAAPQEPSRSDLLKRKRGRRRGRGTT